MVIKTIRKNRGACEQDYKNRNVLNFAGRSTPIQIELQIFFPNYLIESLNYRKHWDEGEQYRYHSFSIEMINVDFNVLYK